MRMMGAAAGAVFALVVTASGVAAELHVDTNIGSDTNPGSQQQPFKSLQAGIDAAMPGDRVIVADGSYAEAPTTKRAGTLQAPITIEAAHSRKAVITASGNVLTIRHGYIVVTGLVIDGQLGPGRTLRLRDAAKHVQLSDLEVRNSGNNCIDLGAATHVVIDKSNIHHCLRFNNGVADAHGITGDAVLDVIVRDCDISFFSGDAIQFSPARAFWDNVLVERTRMWIAPLPRAVGAFQKGQVVGENAFDSKTPKGGPRPRIVFRDVVAYGYKGFIGNQAAFNVKENVDFTLDGATIYGSEIAFRMRGPARATVRNAVTYGNDVAVRYEDAVENLTFQNVTFADPLKNGGGGGPVSMRYSNGLFVAAAVPSEALDETSNMAADASFFVDMAQNDFHLLKTAPAVDAGESIVEVTIDRDNVKRPVGPAHDVGAYEWTAMAAGGAGGSGSATVGAGGAVATGSSSAAVGGGSAASPGGGGDPGLEAGCGCRHAPNASARWSWLLAVACWLRRKGPPPQGSQLS